MPAKSSDAPEDRRRDVTLLLDAIKSGRSDAASELLPVIYGELRRLAAARILAAKIQADLKAVEEWIRTVEVPVHVLWGVKDRILPDFGKTVRRIEDEVRHAKVTRLEHCGHFLQEEDPEEVGRVLAEFFST